MREKLLEVKSSIEAFLQDGTRPQVLDLRKKFSDAFDAINSSCEFEDLRTLLESNEWPQAVHSVQIADENSEKDKEERAEGIADILLPPLEGKKFLDFGCGEGHVANYASKFANISVGYDIVKSERSAFSWNKDEGLFLTTDLESVKAKGPYDVILVYDVMDHLQNSTPKELFALLALMLADGGKIYARMHPWTSRHGGHAYRKINKAFVHLVFTEEELSSMGLELEHNLKIKAPIATYNSWLEGSGLKNSIEPELDQQDVEPFFRENALVRSRILKVFDKDEWRDDCPTWQMSQCFWDYVLERDQTKNEVGTFWSPTS